MRLKDAMSDPAAALWPRVLAGSLNRDEANIDGISPMGWAAIVSAAESHGVAAALALRLKQFDLWSELPEECRERLQQSHRNEAIRALKRRHTLCAVLDVLATEGIVPVAYKGAALAFLAYPDAAMRPMSDLDFWLSEAEMPHGTAALERIGFVQCLNRLERPLALQATFEGEMQMHHPTLDLVELHWGVFPGEWLKRATRIDRVAVNSRVEAHNVFGRPMRVLSTEDHLLQVSLHASVSGKLTVNALRNMMDIALIADSVENWSKVVSNAIQWRIARMIGLTFHIAGTLFAHRALLDAANELGRYAPYAALLGYMDPQAVLDRRQLVDSKRQWAFLLRAIDNKRDAARLMLHTLWPDRRWLSARYGRTGLSTRIDHLLNAGRGQI